MEVRRYYLPQFNPLEVIETAIRPNHRQPRHAHAVIREATLVLKGEVVVMDVIGGISTEYHLKTGDLAVFDPGSCHSMENRSNKFARTLTFKFVGEGKDSNLFLRDKIEECNDPIYQSHTQPLDPRFSSYVEVYNSLDRLLWQIPGFFVAAMGLFLGIFGSVAKDVWAPANLPQSKIVGSLSLLVGVFLLHGVYAMHRIRKHHELMEDDLAKMESSGYFLTREKQREAIKWPRQLRAAPKLFIFSFSVIGLSFVFVGLSFILRNWL